MNKLGEERASAVRHCHRESRTGQGEMHTDVGFAFQLFHLLTRSLPEAQLPNCTTGESPRLNVVVVRKGPIVTLYLYAPQSSVSAKHDADERGAGMWPSPLAGESAGNFGCRFSSGH